MFRKILHIRMPVMGNLCQCTLAAALAGMLVDGLVCTAAGWPELALPHGGVSSGDSPFVLSGRLLGALACAAVLRFWASRLIGSGRLQALQEAEDRHAHLAQCRKLTVRSPALAARFRSKRRRLGRSGELRWRFAADVAHELRTPLAALKIIGENALARPRDQGDPRETIATMLEECERMADVITGLLTLERVDRTGRQLELTCVNLGSLVRESAHSLQVLAEDCKHSMSVVVTSAAQVRAHPVLVRQALLNVIHNAIRHCPDGSRIEIRVESRQYGRLVVQVRDNGHGIPPDSQARIFERFERGGSSQRCGLGLGLAIAKASLEAQGGSIRLAGSGAHGSCFEIELPQWKPPAVVAQHANLSRARSVGVIPWRPAARVRDAPARL